MMLTFRPAHNSHGKHDVTGAFQPESEAFCRLHNARPPIAFDNSLPMEERLSFVRQRIEECGPNTLATLAIFSHGWKDGLQIGARISTVGLLAESIARVATLSCPILTIALYCCDAARDSDNQRADDRAPGPGGDGGFADKLRDELRVRGVPATVYAHATEGHTTWNPYVRRFEYDEMAGGHWLVEPHTALWRPWVKALRKTDLRFRFPFMTTLEIDSELMRTGANT